MLNNGIDVQDHGASEIFRDVTACLEREFLYMRPDITQDFTGSAFEPLYDITLPFYEAHYPILLRDYLPLYFSLWKMTLGDTIGLGNMHQDGGIHYFARNGYDARMLTLWTNIYKDKVPLLSDTDMGIFTVDSQYPDHIDLYDRMAAANTHFFQKDQRRLVDIRQLGNIEIREELSKLKKDLYAFKPGTTIQFSSRLLHGTQPFTGNVKAFSSEQLAAFRVSLSSVWIHRDDLDFSILERNPETYEQLYFSACPPSDWKQLKQRYAAVCAREELRLRLISGLVRHSLDRSANSFRAHHIAS